MPDFAESIANDLSLKPEEQIQQLLAEYAKSADALGISLADESGRALLRTEGTGLLLRHHNIKLALPALLVCGHSLQGAIAY